MARRNELQLGDVIRVTPWGYGTATVINIQDNGEKDLDKVLELHAEDSE